MLPIVQVRVRDEEHGERHNKESAVREPRRVFFLRDRAASSAPDAAQ